MNKTYELFDFLAEIAQNNNREWLAANEARYRDLRHWWLDTLGRIIEGIALWEPAMANLTPREATYRFARDTRFSPDKSPYKLYFSAAFSPWGRKADRAGYYIQLGPGPGARSGIWGGIYCPEPATLRKIRRAIVDNIEEFEQITSAPDLVKAYGSSWDGDALKTIPKGWPKDHPQAALLRLKGYGKHHPLDRRFFADEAWPEKMAALMEPLKPLIDFFNYSIDE